MAERKAVLESVLRTKHSKGHPRSGKAVRTYVGLTLDRIEDGVEVWRFAESGWREESLAQAAADTAESEAGS